MIPKASGISSKAELNTARKIASLCDPMSLDTKMIAFHLSCLPAGMQIRFVDRIMEYVSMAKDSEHESIRAWANSYTS